MLDLWIAFLIGNGSGGALGYWLQPKLADHFAARAEGRQLQREDLKVLRDALLEFLGPLRGHFSWLENVRDPNSAGGEPSPNEKARLIGEWVTLNAPRFSKARRPPWIISAVAYQLAQGNRQFLDQRSDGYELLQEAWDDLQDYADDLTRRLHGSP